MTGALLALFAVAAPVSAQTVSVSVAYPLEGHQLPDVPATFILGVTTPAAGTLLLNGTTIQQHPNGAFLAFVPVQPGTFTFHLEFLTPSATATLDRSVRVSPPPPVFLPGDPLDLDPASLQPAEAAGLQPGDWTLISARGTPGVRAQYKVSRATGWTALHERPETPGLYEAAFFAPPGLLLEKAKVRIRLSRGWRWTTREAPGRITSPAAFDVVETSTEPFALRTGPNRTQYLFPQMGTRIRADGRSGGQVRLRLSAQETLWAAASGLRTLPLGTPLPEAVLQTIRTSAGPRETTLALGLSERVVYQAAVEGDLFRLRLYNTVNNANWIDYDSADAYVKETRWRQEGPGVVVVEARLDPAAPLWGYRVEQVPGRLSVVLRRPPTLAGAGAAPWKGLTVVLDPGHSPGKEEGAIGPTGRREAEANMAIALELKLALEVKGASVVLTRSDLQEVSLADRPRLAWAAKGDLFVSIHNNGLPDGVDPYAVPRGFMVFYYHPQSLEIARTVHAAYRRSSPAADEGLHLANFLVAREPGMPAILTESDSMIFPAVEERLFMPEYQKLIARIHIEGIEAFLKESGALKLKAGP